VKRLIDSFCDSHSWVGWHLYLAASSLKEPPLHELSLVINCVCSLQTYVSTYSFSLIGDVVSSHRIDVTPQAEHQQFESPIAILRGRRKEFARIENTPGTLLV
jgi:hypothetical protein